MSNGKSDDFLIRKILYQRVGPPLNWTTWLPITNIKHQFDLVWQFTIFTRDSFNIWYQIFHALAFPRDNHHSFFINTVLAQFMYLTYLGKNIFSLEYVYGCMYWWKMMFRTPTHYFTVCSVLILWLRNKETHLLPAKQPNKSILRCSWLKKCFLRLFKLYFFKALG